MYHAFSWNNRVYDKNFEYYTFFFLDILEVHNMWQGLVIGHANNAQSEFVMVSYREKLMLKEANE